MYIAVRLKHNPLWFFTRNFVYDHYDSSYMWELLLCQFFIMALDASISIVIKAHIHFIPSIIST